MDIKVNKVNKMIIDDLDILILDEFTSKMLVNSALCSGAGYLRSTEASADVYGTRIMLEIYFPPKQKDTNI